MGSKCKEIPPGDNKEHWPAKKAKGKQPARHHGDIGVKIGMLTSVKDVYVLGRTVWYTIQDK